MRGSGPSMGEASALRAAVERCGYYPEVVLDAVDDALGGESVRSFVVHHEPTFDRDEIRRHVTVLALTPSRLLVAHTDEHPADDRVLTPYASTSTEAVRLTSIESVVVTRVVPDPARFGGGHGAAPVEALLTVGWGAVGRLDLEPAACDDPACEADHGYTGTVSADDFSLRMSTAADGKDGVEALLDFGRALSAATSGPG